MHTLADLLPREKHLVVLEDFPLPTSSYFKRYAISWAITLGATIAVTAMVVVYTDWYFWIVSFSTSIQSKIRLLFENPK